MLGPSSQLGLSVTTPDRPLAEADTVTTPSEPVESSRRGRTRERLVDAAYEVFAARGVHAASVEQITEHAGFTRGAFYSNFSTKEELFFALMERENTNRLSRLREQMDVTLPALDEGVDVSDEAAFGAIVLTFLDTQLDGRRWCLIGTEFALLAMRDPEVASAFVDYQRLFLGQLTDIVTTAIDRVGRRFLLPAVEACSLLASIYEDETMAGQLRGEPEPETMERIRARIAALILLVTAPAPGPVPGPVPGLSAAPSS